MSCLDTMKLSELQKAPVLDERSPLLVAAGAGSGKTRLLVAYFVKALVEEGLQPEQLVAVTFTRKAASELVGRIRKNLEDLGRSDLARSLDRATVGTIHGLCRRLIRERALQTDTDPAAGVLEAEAASLVKEKLSREVWDRVAERATDEQLGVLALAGDKLRRQVVPLYDRLRGIGQELPQVVVATGPESNGGDLGAAVSLQAAAGELRAAIAAALVAAAGCQRITATLRKDLDGLERCLDWLDKPLTPERRAIDLDDTLGFFPSKRTPAMEASFQPVRLALTGYRQALAGLRLRPLVEAMNVLLAEFHAAYEAHKLEKGLLDFSDLELRAHRLACSATRGRSAGLAAGLAAAGRRVPRHQSAAVQHPRRAGRLAVVDGGRRASEHLPLQGRRRGGLPSEGGGAHVVPVRGRSRSRPPSRRQLPQPAGGPRLHQPALRPSDLLRGPVRGALRARTLAP